MVRQPMGSKRVPGPGLLGFRVRCYEGFVRLLFGVEGCRFYFYIVNLKPETLNPIYVVQGCLTEPFSLKPDP